MTPTMPDEVPSQPTPRHLFLDLEDTVITPVTDGWGHCALLNVEKIQRFMLEFKPQFLHVFSFAIWNQQELTKFNDHCRPKIERALGMEFCGVPTVDNDIIPICCSVMGLGMGSVDFKDASDFWGKQESFRLNMRHLGKMLSSDIEVAFLDDAVFNESFKWPDLHITGQILNIDLMSE